MSTTELIPTAVHNLSKCENYSHFRNDTECEADVTFILPWWRQVFWSILYANMVIVSTIGNLVVIWIVMTNKRMRTVTNYFLVNLSVADCMVATLNVTFNFIYMLNSDWPFGSFYCKFSQFISVVSISASVFTLVAISIDRYVAIMSPLRPRLGKRATLAVATSIWISSASIGLPNFIFYIVETDPTTQRTVCFAEWPDGRTNFSKIEYYYNVIFMILTYFLPIALMSFAYARVGIELWGSQYIGEITQRQMDNIKSKRRVVKMMVVVVLIFAFCWLPFHIYFILTAHFPEITMHAAIQEVYLTIYWLAMSNSMYNPIIYCWMNSKFRRGFRQFFWCCGTFFGSEKLRRRHAMPLENSARRSQSASPSGKNGTLRISLHSACST